MIDFKVVVVRSAVEFSIVADTGGHPVSSVNDFDCLTIDVHGTCFNHAANDKVVITFVSIHHKRGHAVIDDKCVAALAAVNVDNFSSAVIVDSLIQRRSRDVAGKSRRCGCVCSFHRCRDHCCVGRTDGQEVAFAVLHGIVQCDAERTAIRAVAFYRDRRDAGKRQQRGGDLGLTGSICQCRRLLTVVGQFVRARPIG